MISSNANQWKIRHFSLSNFDFPDKNSNIQWKSAIPMCFQLKNSIHARTVVFELLNRNQRDRLSRKNPDNWWKRTETTLPYPQKGIFLTCQTQFRLFLKVFDKSGKQPENISSLVSKLLETAVLKGWAIRGGGWKFTFIWHSWMFMEFYCISCILCCKRYSAPCYL